jgi:hypothetical protein
MVDIISKNNYSLITHEKSYTLMIHYSCGDDNDEGVEEKTSYDCFRFEKRDGVWYIDDQNYQLPHPIATSSSDSEIPCIPLNNWEIQLPQTGRLAIEGIWKFENEIKSGA